MQNPDGRLDSCPRRLFRTDVGRLFRPFKIDPDYWGGLPLTVILTLFGMTASTPLGILLALGRRSKMSAVRMLCIGYIELVRGVP